jgi:hypothetical protein
VDAGEHAAHRPAGGLDRGHGRGEERAGALDPSSLRGGKECGGPLRHHEQTVLAAASSPDTAQDSAIYFHIRTSRGNPTLTGGPELATSGEENVYRPGWAPVAELETIHLVPEHALAAVRALL